MGGASSTPVSPFYAVHELYAFDERLSSGKFSQIRLGVSRDLPGRDVMVHIVDARRKKHGDEVHKATTAMIEAWVGLGAHRHCVELEDFFFEREHYYLVTEPVRCITHALSTVMALTWKQVCGMFHDMLKGICHVHSRGIVHRDIKLDSFFFGGDGRGTVKLGDFGSAAYVADGSLTEMHGTAPYMSPEMAASREYGRLTDMWSFGVVMYLVFSGDFPYTPKSYKGSKLAAVRESIDLNEPPLSWDRLFDDTTGVFDRDLVRVALHLMENLLERKKSLRTSSATALRHSFFDLGDEISSQPAFRDSKGRPKLARACKKAGMATAEQNGLRKRKIKPVKKKEEPVAYDPTMLRRRAFACPQHSMQLPDLAVSATEPCASAAAWLGSRRAWRVWPGSDKSSGLRFAALGELFGFAKRPSSVSRTSPAEATPLGCADPPVGAAPGEAYELWRLGFLGGGRHSLMQGRVSSKPSCRTSARRSSSTTTVEALADAMMPSSGSLKRSSESYTTQAMDPGSADEACCRVSSRPSFKRSGSELRNNVMRNQLIYGRHSVF